MFPPHRCPAVVTGSYRLFDPRAGFPGKAELPSPARVQMLRVACWKRYGSVSSGTAQLLVGHRRQNHARYSTCVIATIYWEQCCVTDIWYHSAYTVIFNMVSFMPATIRNITSMGSLKSRRGWWDCCRLNRMFFRTLKMSVFITGQTNVFLASPIHPLLPSSKHIMGSTFLPHVASSFSPMQFLCQQIVFVVFQFVLIRISI